MPDRRAEQSGAERARQALFTAFSHPTIGVSFRWELVARAMDALRSLPVEDRMRAMGMRRWWMPDSFYEELSTDEQQAVCDLPPLYTEPER